MNHLVMIEIPGFVTGGSSLSLEFLKVILVVLTSPSTSRVRDCRRAHRYSVIDDSLSVRMREAFLKTTICILSVVVAFPGR